MTLENIFLTNFRNYKLQNIDFIDGINLFVGNNAQGKTNIIEAIYMCAFGKSYRTIKDNEVVNFNSDYSRIQMEYKKENIKNKIELFIDKDSKKSIKKNDIKITKIADHIGDIPVVIFSPDSLDIVKGAPGKRRKFLDMICSQLSKKYLVNLQEYNKCLKLKNTLLKNENIDLEYLNVLHVKMSEYIQKIVEFRNEVVKKLISKSKVIHNSITSNTEYIELEYVSDFIGLDKTNIKQILDKYINIEKMRKSSLKGIQKDDIYILIDNKDVGKFGSQGQNRTALLTLKLANFEVLMEEKEETPILLLDDIMSELDRLRINFLLKYIENYQSVITTTDANFVKDIEKIKISKVFRGTLEI